MTINFKELHNIEKALEKYKKSKLLIVSKNQSFSSVKNLIDNGYNLFGENRVQEAFNKFKNFDEQSYILHLIGPLQTNKVKIALNLFHVIQSVDRKSLVLEISKQTKKQNNILTKIFYIQVNIGSENQKSGVYPEHVSELYDFCLINNLKISGLMCIPPFGQDPIPYFNHMKKIRDSIDKNMILSMGMSNDYELSLKCGSNMIRIGSKIFT